jgi:hypothetical protein
VKQKAEEGLYGSPQEVIAEALNFLMSGTKSWLPCAGIFKKGWKAARADRPMKGLLRILRNVAVKGWPSAKTPPNASSYHLTVSRG